MRKLYDVMRCGAAVIIGIVFFCSGVIKLIDPVGTSLIVKEYFSFLQVSFLEPHSLMFALALSLLEACCGAALITGFLRRLSAYVSGVLIFGFTILTFFLWLKNPPMDCGCFGEALHLSHLQSFIKNVVLLGLAMLAFMPLPEKRKKKNVGGGIAFGVAVMMLAGLSLHSTLYLPLLEFTPFKVGTDLFNDKASAEVEEQVSINLIYEKDGNESVFGLDNLPDSSWTFVRTETNLDAEAVDMSTRLEFRDASGNYCDSLLLSSPVFAVSIYKEGYNSKETFEFISAARNRGYRVLVLSSLGSLKADCLENESEDFSELLEEDVFSADYKSLITLNRSNGGATLISDGIIVKKWSNRSLPELEELNEIKLTDSIQLLGESSRSSVILQFSLLFTLLLMILV